MIGIYKITNKINGKLYIGQSVDILRRWRNEKSRSCQKNSTEYYSVLSKAFRKYGIENFSFEIVEESSIEELDKQERFWANYYNSYVPNGYNVAECGRTSNHKKPEWLVEATTMLLEGKTNQEIAGKLNISWRTISDFNCGVCWHNENTDYPIRREINAKKCRLTNEKEEQFKEQNKIFQENKKKELEEEKKKLEEQLKTHYLDWTMQFWAEESGISEKSLRAKLRKYNLMTFPEYKRKIKEQNQKNKEQKIIVRDDGKEFINGSQAAKFCGQSCADSGHINDCCRGKRKTAYGHTWHYKE